MTGVPAPNHYSYRHYADPSTAASFDDRRFGGPIGELVADAQARVLADFIGTIQQRDILDVGTGTGRAALFLAKSGGRVTGVDASDAMLAVARQRAAAEGLTVDWRVGDAHALDFPDRRFDVAVSLRVLMHTPDWRRCVAELCRVAERRVIVDFPSTASFAVLESAARRVAHSAGMRTEPYRTLRFRTVAGAFERNGFRVRAVHRQFVLPIALHKTVGSRRLTQAVEGTLNRAGLLAMFGSPVSVVAERCASS